MNDLSVAGSQEPLKFSSLYSENNGEGYLGKIVPTAFVKSFENYDCKTSSQPDSKNVQGIAIYDGTNVVVTNDNCMDLSLTVAAAEEFLDIQPYNQEMFLFNKIPYENRQTFADDSYRATEVFCRDATESSGLDILIKYDDVVNSSVKILMGEKFEEGRWMHTSVNYFPVKKSNSSKLFSTEAFRLTLANDELSKNVFSANLEMTLDGNKIEKTISCYAMNMNPTIPAVSDPTMVAQWSFNKNLEEFVNNITSIVVDADQTFGYIEGRFGSAAQFDGIDDRIQVAPHPEINDLPAITVAMWVWPNLSGGLVRKSGGANGSETSGWIFGIDNQSQQLFFKVIFADGFLGIRTSESGLIPLTWNHVAFTWDGTSAPESAALYINGEKVAYLFESTTNGMERSSDLNEPLLIGDRPSPLSPRFNGSMDQLIIWNRALDFKEVRYLFRNGVPN